MRMGEEANSKWLLSTLGCAGVIVIGFYFAAAWFGRAIGPIKEIGRSVQCQENLRLVLRAHSMYADDYEDHLPPAEKWMDRIDFFLDKKKRDPLRCPEAVSKQADGYGYAMNGEVGGKVRAKIADLDKTPVVFDSRDLQRSAVSKVLETAASQRHPGHTKKGEPLTRGVWVGYGSGGVKFDTRGKD